MQGDVIHRHGWQESEAEYGIDPTVSEQHGCIDALGLIPKRFSRGLAPSV